MNCFACNRIEKIKEKKNPYFIKELSESYVVLGDYQVYEGYCILILNDHSEHLEELPLKRQLRLFEDVALTAKAIKSAFKPQRLNYECLGNSLNHIHWHIFPRYSDDADPTSTIWVRPENERNIIVKTEKLAELSLKIKQSFEDCLIK